MKTIDHKKSINLFTIIAVAFFEMHLLLLFGGEFYVNKWVWFGVNTVLGIAVPALMRSVLLKCSETSPNGFLGICLLLLAAPYFIFSLISWTSYRALAVYVLFALLLYLLYGMKTQFFVPVVMVAMLITARSPAFELLLAAFPLFCYSYIKNRDSGRRYGVLFIPELVLMLLVIVVEKYFVGKLSDTRLITHETDISFLTVGNFPLWLDSAKYNILLVIPLTAILVLIWSKVLSAQKSSLLNLTMAFDIIISVIFLLIFIDRAHILCIVQLIVSLFLLYDNRKYISGGLDNALAFFKKRPVLTVVLFLFFCGIGYRVSADFSSGDRNFIADGIDRFFLVNS